MKTILALRYFQLLLNLFNSPINLMCQFGKLIHFDFSPINQHGSKKKRARKHQGNI